MDTRKAQSTDAAGRELAVPQRMTHAEFEEELVRLRLLYPVVSLLTEEQVKTERHCLLCGQDCPCMRQVCLDVFESHGEETKTLRMDDNRHQATARYVEVDGEACVLLTATPITMADSALNSELLYRDALSGVYNRRFYEDNLRLQRLYAGVAVIDLDDFKLINDTLGHHAGDMAIEEVGKTLRSCVRESDMVVRYGGDEFVVVLPGIPADNFSRKLRVIADALSRVSLPGYSHIGITASVGGALAAGRTVDEAVRAADKLMYRAKQSKDSVVTELDVAKGEADDEPGKPLLLIIDDSFMNREILSEMLKDDYDIIEAADGQGGIAQIEKHGTEISLVLLDIVMPGQSGFDVLATMTRREWIADIPVIMISSEDSDEIVLRAYELGASDYISRPFDARIVRQRVSNIMRLYTKQRRLTQLLSQQFHERERDSRMLVDIMGGAMELRNGESGPHVHHVRTLTEILLERLVRKTDKYELNAAERIVIAMASTLHDIGKLAIDDKILNKPGRLTDEEFAIMKTHTTVGADMLEQLDQYTESALVQTARDIARWHHERYDGHGYPDGLVGDDIPISAQVVSVADVYDALTSDRVYKKAFTHEKAINMILNGECGTFNPLLLECLVDVEGRIRAELDDAESAPPPFIGRELKNKEAKKDE